MLSETIRKLPAKYARVAAIARYFREHPEVLRGYFSYARRLGLLSALSRLIKSIAQGGGRRILAPPAATPQLLLRSGSGEPIVILASSQYLYIGQSISAALSQVGIEASIIQEPPIHGYGSGLHLVICARMFAQLPPSYIVFHLEQLVGSNWFTEDYLRILENAAAILDYSTANIGFLTHKGLNSRQIFYVPLDHPADYRFEPDYELEDRGIAAENRLLLKGQSNRFDYFFYRFLLATDNITFEEFWNQAGHKAELPSDTICLSLPEYVERATAFNEENRFGFSCFPGLRHTQSWIGCAMSYKLLIMLARQQGLRQITICEDDVEFPPDFEMRWRDIQECLNDPDITWDIFAGLIADLDKDIQVLATYKFGSQQFAVINKLMSMVFNVYSKRVYDAMAEWDENNHDVTTNTIDRYLERHGALNILTIDPFLVGHKESQQSTIWGVDNSHYTDLILASGRLLKEKILAYNSNTKLPCKHDNC